MGSQKPKKVTKKAAGSAGGFLVSRQPCYVYTVSRKGCGCCVWKRWESDFGDLCSGAGGRDSDFCNFPGGCTAVSRGISVDCLRMCLLQILKMEGGLVMQIVVWKSPKALGGLLRRIFKIKR